ncbi:serine protease inhibitor 28Dc-like [Episyrphus balteatus]|uniref:serine protease inhibitor 28Dc-like n=1 Tax=Episyrphus balteatus TaxID=286459 RepID=UPI00248526B4|nr:serine protease inhibitor 28Dc-like [Episyrphus balteatus]
MRITMMLPEFLLGLAALLVTNAMAEFNLNDFKIPEITRDIRYDQETSERVAQSVMNFAHKLAVALDTDEYPNTQIFSPLSVMSALSLLQMGSYGNSYKQLNQIFDSFNGKNELSSSKIHEEFGWLLQDVVLQSETPKRPHTPTRWRSLPFDARGFGASGRKKLEGHTIRVSNALFVQNGFSLKPDYAYAAQSVYKSEVTPLDFRRRTEDAKHYINSWVNQNTLGKIPTIIDNELVKETNMILASTLYFKGFWEQVFFDAGNYRQNFYPDGPDSIPVGIVLMATGGSFPFYHSEEYNCRIIGLPYQGNQTTMYVIQPIDSTRLKLQQLQKDLTGERLNELISKMEYATATLAFPKFHVTNKIELKTPLEKMGITDIFVNGLADLALIADPEENSAEAIAKASASFSNPPWGAIYVEAPKHAEILAEASPSSLSFGSQRSPFSGPLDRYDEAPLIFSRFSEDSSNETSSTTDKLEQKDKTKEGDSMVSTTMSPTEMPTEVEKVEDIKNDTVPSRKRRQTVPDSAISLQRLDQLRSIPGLKRPHLYVDEILHKVDFNVNEQGTEAAAATLALLTKSGNTVSMRCDAPFLILVRHDPTKLPLFYGIINIPE